MKRFIQTLKNIWSIEDLRKRILYTIGLVLVYRIGCYVVLPGVDPSQLQGLQSQGSEGLMGSKDRIKILGRGELNKSINVTAHAFSASAKQAIEAKGGVATVIE